GFLTMPSRRQSGPLPSDFPAEMVKIQSSSGSDLSGWFLPARNSNAPIIILMHGVRGCRGDMLGRARFLHEAGYGTLLFDFQAHGDSPGKQITFGFLESRDAQAAVAFTRRKSPSVKIALIGVSMGGAAALLASPPLQVDAMILESVYPDIVRATEDRMVMRLGLVGKIFTPLLTCQLGLRLDVTPNQLRPIDGVTKVLVPKYFFAGTEDHQTTLVEANELFAAAAEPKQFWAVEGAGHVNLHTYAKERYEQRVLAFLAQTLKRD
ncbi:MAG: alpha/beta hydrolase, partial [Limisphaerales bacterium]